MGGGRGDSWLERWSQGMGGEGAGQAGQAGQLRGRFRDALQDPGSLCPAPISRPAAP